MFYLLFSLLLVVSEGSYSAPDFLSNEGSIVFDQEIKAVDIAPMDVDQEIKAVDIAPMDVDQEIKAIDVAPMIVDQEIEAVDLKPMTVGAEMVVPVDHINDYSGKDAKLYEIMGRLEQLQLEMQELRGLVEAQTYVVERFSNHKRVANKSGSLIDSGATNTNLMNDDSVDKLSPDPNVMATIQREEIISVDVVKTDKVSVQGNNELRELLPEPWTSSNGVVATEELDFQQAYGVLRNGFTEYAIDLFQDFLTDYPESQYADQAQFWLAEAYLVNQRPNLADQEFEKLILQYPSSSQIPVALLKRSYLAVDKNNLDQAKVFLTQVTISYPGSTAGHLAAKKLVELKVSP